MVYVIDTSVISVLYKNYYRKQFPSLWTLFDKIVEQGRITSTREVLRELQDRGGEASDWAEDNKYLFPMPNAIEGGHVAAIYKVKHFQSNIEKQKILRGGSNADSFLIARARAIEGTVLTMEQLKPNSVKIPNICEYFDVRCVDLQRFMEIENWKF